MSDASFIRAREQIQAAIADSSNNTFVDECLNQAQREVSRARRWPELMTRIFFNTEAAYETGTMAVTENSATITLTGGTLPTTVASSGMRFARSVTDPWYPVRTRSSGTVAILASNYIDDTNAATDFILYKSHYSLPPTVDRVEEIWVHTGGEAVALCNAATDQKVSEFIHYPSGPGVPTHYLMIERDVDGNRQLLLGPETPDDVYRVECVVRRKVTDNTFEGNLDDSRWPLIVSRAKSMAYEPEFYDRSIEELRRYKVLLQDAWEQDGDVETQHVRVGQTRIDYPGRWSMDNLIGNGRVDEPTT